VTASAERSSSRVPVRRIAAALAVVAALVVLGRWLGGSLPAFAEWVESLGVWGPAAFVAGYAAAVVAFVPASLLTLVAGAIFGVAEGTAIVFVAAVLGSSAAFLIARHLARRAIEQRIAGDARFAAIDRAVGAEGRKIVLLLRLSPAFPFNLLNYGLGLTRVSFQDYLTASVGMLPGTLLYVYLGKVAGDVAALAGGARPAGGSAGTLLLVVGLVATVIVTALITRIARRALAEATAA
jgi:uncharacterized membrane protein YdjX (TVP38/TMEM64 family)